MDIEALAREYKGQITLWGEIDRQQARLRHAARRTPGGPARRAFDDGSGGLIAQCEWANDTPHANIEAVFSAWSEPLIKSENRANRKGAHRQCRENSVLRRPPRDEFDRHTLRSITLRANRNPFV